LNCPTVQPTSTPIQYITSLIFQTIDLINVLSRSEVFALLTDEKFHFTLGSENLDFIRRKIDEQDHFHIHGRSPFVSWKPDKYVSSCQGKAKSIATKMTDWENREFVESIRLHMQRLASYLNELDNKARAHLATVEQRLEVVERKLEQLEAGIDRIPKRTENEKQQQQAE
jgi:hypothetical protein